MSIVESVFVGFVVVYAFVGIAHWAYLRKK